VQYLFLLVLVIICAQIVEIFGLIALANGAPAANPRPNAVFDAGAWFAALFWSFAPLVGPHLVFAFTGLSIRAYYWTLWCLTFCASLYAAFILFGLLTEYGMAREAVAAAARGSRYMNCGGHPRLFFILFAVPFTVGSVVVSMAVLGLEATIRSVLDCPTENTPENGGATTNE
jgi:hypothetical protein